MGTGSTLIQKPAKNKQAKVAGEVTERRKIEHALRESEQRFQLLAHNVSDVIWIVDMNLRPTYISPAVENLVGYSVEEVMGISMEEILLPDSVEVVMKLLAEDRASVHVCQKDVPGSRTLELQLRCQDGSTVWAEITVNVVRDNDGRPVSFFGIARDVTERKRAEAELRGQKELIDCILATMSNAVLVVGADSRIILANMACSETFKVGPERVEGRQVSDVIPVADLCQAISKVSRNKRPQGQLEFRHEINGHERLLVADITPMRDGEVLLVLRDITDERESQQRLYLTDRLASVGEMASGIAHELNNPLTSVIGLSQLLMDEELPDDIKEDVASIYSEAQRAANIVKNLLSFARKHEPFRQPTQINSVVDDVLRLRAHEHRTNNIRVDTRLAPQLPEVMVDYFEMLQVFLNIVLNSESAMMEAHNHGTLKIETESVDNVVRVSFTDCGPGIAGENLNRIFDPFFTTKEVGRGTGLGLSICHGIVTSHGGNIYARSKIGKGTTFVVELPVDSTGAKEGTTW